MKCYHMTVKGSPVGHRYGAAGLTKADSMQALQARLDDEGGGVIMSCECVGPCDWPAGNVVCYN
jgi:hypothetical protein